MLTQHAALRLDNDGSGLDIEITPLFLQNHADPWEPNEIFDLVQTTKLADGKWEILPERLSLGKLIIDDKQQWHYDGDGDMADADLKKIADFVLNGD